MCFGIAIGSFLIKKFEALIRMHQEAEVLFQGNDPREFWVRAEDKNTQTARKYHNLGESDYAALEVFSRLKTITISKLLISIAIPKKNEVNKDLIYLQNLTIK